MKTKIGIYLAGPLGFELVSSPEFESLLGHVQLTASVGNTPGLAVDFRSLITGQLNKLGLLAVSEDHLHKSSDVLVAVGWRKLVSGLSEGQRIFVFHDSLLPDLRGWNPLVSALELGREESGVTLFLADEGMDTGAIVDQRAFPLGLGVRIARAIELAGAAVAEILVDFLDALLNESITFRTQDDSEASISPWRDNADYLIDWTRSAEDLQRFVESRGWPYLGASTSLNGVPLRVLKARVFSDLPVMALSAEGKVIKLAGENPVVACGSGYLEIMEMQNDNGGDLIVRSIRSRFV